MGAGSGTMGRPAQGRRTGRAGAARGLERARLVGLEGTRRTYITRETGRILHTEDTILGKVEFRASAVQTASARGVEGYTVELAQMRGGREMEEGREMRGMGRRGTGSERSMRAGAAAGVPRAGGQIPASLDYGFRITTDLVVD